MIRRNWPLLVSAVCLVAAVLVALLAVELVRWQRQMSRDDRLFRATPERPGLWQVSKAPPLDPSTFILGLRDDIAYRRALQRFWLAEPVPAHQARPDWQTSVAEAQGALARIAETDSDPHVRAQALNLMGVLQLTDTVPSDPAARAAVLGNGIADFENAVKLDPSNPDAAANLELVLRAYAESLAFLPGHGASGGANSGPAGGAGLAGSGY